MKKAVVWSGVIAMLILASCTSKDEVTQELIEYHNKTWMAIQEMKGERISVLKDQTDPSGEALIDASEFDVEEALSAMDQVNDHLKTIEPEHSDIQQLHDLLTEAEESASIALGDQIAYVNGDTSDEQVEKSHENLFENFNEFVDYRDDLMKKYNVVWGEETSIPGARKMVKE